MIAQLICAKIKHENQIEKISIDIHRKSKKKLRKLKCAKNEHNLKKTSIQIKSRKTKKNAGMLKKPMKLNNVRDCSKERHSKERMLKLSTENQKK